MPISATGRRAKGVPKSLRYSVTRCFHRKLRRLVIVYILESDIADKGLIFVNHLLHVDMMNHSNECCIIKMTVISSVCIHIL